MAERLPVDNFDQQQSSASAPARVIHDLDSCRGQLRLFVFNLAQYPQQLGAAVTVLRNDDVPLATVPAYDGVLLEPGPGTPADSGVCPEIVREFGPQLPIFGVCLGHKPSPRCTAASWTGRLNCFTVRRRRWSTTEPASSGICRHRSLRLATTLWPYGLTQMGPDLRVTARTTSSGVIMGLRHRIHPVEGVQFHPSRSRLSTVTGSSRTG